MGLQSTIKALSDPIRREILEMLKAGRLSAGEIAEHFPVSGAAISKHLAVLREADLIGDTREGKFIYYDLNTSVLEEVMLWISGLKGEKNEYAKFWYFDFDIDYYFASHCSRGSFVGSTVTANSNSLESSRSS